MEYRVLGTLEVFDGERSLPLAGEKQRALLALLLLNANRVVATGSWTSCGARSRRKRR
jgi:DNA-binding SARP family transcriptional activator